MWISKTATLTDRMLDSIADIYTEEKGMAPQVVRQVRERLLQHALLASFGSSSERNGF